MGQSSSTSTSRRAAFGAAAGLAITPVAPTIIRASSRQKLDFNDPQDQLYALIKMTGDLEDGKETVSWMKGIVHAILEDGKILEPLFYAGTLAFSRSYKQDDGSYKNMSNFTICYMDLETEDVLDSWYNLRDFRELCVEHYRIGDSTTQSFRIGAGPDGITKFGPPDNK